MAVEQKIIAFGLSDHQQPLPRIGGVEHHQVFENLHAEKTALESESSQIVVQRVPERLSILYVHQDSNNLFIFLRNNFTMSCKILIAL